MLKRVEVFCLRKSLREFALDGGTNVRQNNLTCVGFAERTFEFLEIPFCLNIIFQSCFKKFIQIITT